MKLKIKIQGYSLHRFFLSLKIKTTTLWIILLSAGLDLHLFAQSDELRGTWAAWAGLNVPSKTDLATMMDDLATHNMNTVYADIWRSGYPYFPSTVFCRETGLYTDPNLDEGRDVLTDFIAEGHRVGLEIDAWFELGFAACQGDNIDLYTSHPDWFARKRSGDVIFFADGGIPYHWLSHCNRDAQRFLIGLCQEVARRYDVDGIEMDRIRYPDLDCGYDSATVELYKSEHSGNAPPTNIADPNWIRWRADKLNAFVIELYDSIKAVNPDITVSNAPLWYGYNNFCQDYPWWLNNGHLDIMSTQIYFASNAEYTGRLDDELLKINDRTKLYPGISTVANSQVTPKPELIKMIESTRNRGMQGNVIWYYSNLKSYLDTLMQTVYAEKVKLPYRPADWRLPGRIVHETDSTTQKSSGWVTYTTLPGYDEKCLYTISTANPWIEYYADIDQDAYYEVYVYIVRQPFAHPGAEYSIYHEGGVDTILVNQNLKANARWYKLGDFYLIAGLNKKVIRLTAQNIDIQHILFTDAMMLIRSHRPPELILHTPESTADKNPNGFDLFAAYPNPFNNTTRIKFQISHGARVEISIFNILGEKIITLLDQKLIPGVHSISWQPRNTPSGIYFYSVSAGGQKKSGKLILIK